MNQDTGELIDASKLKPLIDFDKVKEFRNNMGYYQIVTSELTMGGARLRFGAVARLLFTHRCYKKKVLHVFLWDLSELPQALTRQLPQRDQL